MVFTADAVPPESGIVKFGMHEKNGHVVIDIVDTGDGIGAADLPHIFDKFYRASDPNVAAEQGTGLGLSITAEIVRLHGGDITVQSELGKGSHFTIRLPKEEYYVAEPANG